MRLLRLWLGAATLTRAAHFQDDWVMEYPRPSGAQDSPDADLAIRVDFSSLKGPGQRLLNGIAMGVTSAREVFESQFILDMSLATGVHTDRIVVLNVTEGDVHFAWRWTTTVIRFRILAACPPGLEIYVEMGEAASRRIETIETKEPPCSATPLDARRTCAHPCENSPDVPSVVRDLTNQTQFLDSPLFAGDRAKKVTAATDRHWGLVALDWDMSLRLQFSMDVVSNPAEHLQQDAGLGEAAEHFEASKHRAFGHMTLNRGLERFCEAAAGASGRTEASHTASAYCEWENYFEEDVSRALDIERHRVEVLAVRPAAPDQVLAHFRIFPTWSGGTPVADCVSDLLEQVRDPTSRLYDGNVTVRVDPSWGVSGVGGTPRKRTSDHLPYAVRGNSSLPYHGYAAHSINEAYERCKATQRCARGYEHYYVENATRYHTTQVFAGGAHRHADLFAPFEDWRVGTGGWGPRGFARWDGTANATGAVRGAHVAPMRLKRLGAPPVRTVDPWGWCHERQACSAVKFNGGLVLNRARLARDVALQEKLIKNIRDDLAWVESWRETAVLDADGARTRFDVIQLMRKRADDIRAKIKAEEKVLKDLNGTQCTLLRRCQLFINTSSITIRGVYEIDGELLIQPGGEEIAVFSFDQIDLGPEVNVTVVGQRPLILASRSTARFQTPFVVAPGTLGGFPGGYSVGSDPADVLRDDPRDVPLGDPQILDGTIASTNANGPGAPSVRVHLRSVRTEASDVDEIQRVTLAGDAGENLGGFWRLTYRDFRSRSLPPDASADLVRRACEEDLNRAHAVHRSTGLDNRVEDHAPGVGRCAVAKRRGVMGDDAAQWTLTFTSQIGAMELLGVEDHLTGMGANIRIERLQGGNSLGGTFALKFRGTATRPLAHDATSLAVARALVEDLPHVVAASATRSDGDRVGGECDDGLCEDGPRPGGGLEWTLTLVTLDDVITPRAPVGYDWKGAPRGPLDGDVYDETPTAAPTYDTLAPSYDTSVPSLKPTGEWLEPEGPCPNLTAAGALTGAGASVVARRGHFLSHRPILAATNRTAFGCEASFTLAFGGGGAAHGGGGRVALYANALWRPDDVSARIDVAGGACREWDAAAQRVVDGCADGKAARQHHRDGSRGTVRVDTLFDLGYDVEIHEDNTVGGAYGTYGSLRVDGRLRDTGAASERNAAAGDRVIEPRISFDGPEFQLARRARPARLSFFVRLDPRNDTQIPRRAGTWGGMVALYDAPDEIPPNTDPWAVGNPSFASPLPKRATPVHANSTVAVGVAISDRLVHGGGFRAAPGEREEQGPAGVLGGAGRGAPRSTLLHKARLRRWYKVDVSLDWTRMVYDVWVDDVLRADDAPIGGDAPWTREATGVNRLGVYAISDGGTLRVDEIYVGPDHTMAFRCPKTTRRGPEFETPRPDAKGWDAEDLGGRTTRAPMVRHDTHVSKRDLYKFTDARGSTNRVDRLDNGGLVAYDGAGLVDFRSDVEQRFGSGDLRGGANPVHAGALLTLAGGVAGGGGPSRDLADRATRGYAENERWTATDHADAEHDLQYEGNYGAFPATTEDADAPQRQTQFDNDAKYYTAWYGKDGGRPTPTHLWYGEHDAPHGPLNDGDAAPDWLKGGVGACSTDDLIEWKREGIALHYANLTDMTDRRDAWQLGCDGYGTIHGTKGGYGCVGSKGLVASRPRVLTADVEQKPDSNDPYASTRPDAPRVVQGHGYVMWMVVHNGSKGRGLAGVASSAHAGGPFHFRRTLYPDGNETRDMAVWAVGGEAPHPKTVEPRSTALLGRTYFAEIEHLLPGAQMQPIWEMAKKKDSTGKWVNDFGLSYHRGIYQKDYDDYHDIYLQRWRLEDKPWKVWCVERANPGNRYLVPRGHSTGENYALCPDPEFYKVVEGQGYDDTYFTTDGVKSRFMDPDDPSKSEWRPNSVPDVRAQPWKNSYRDGACGLRQKDEDYGLNDPEIPTRELQDRGNCSNIEDNPLHPTMPDELVKELYVVERRRAKFVAVSALTPDLLDTTSQLDSFEGELEDAALDSLIQSYGQFDWSIDGNAEARIATTFQPPLLPPDDFNLKPRREALGRFHQYSFQPNDRARYSLSCIYDLTCPVNFNDQLIDPDVDKQAVDPAIWWATSTTNYHPDAPLPWTQVAETSWARRRLEEASFEAPVEAYDRPDPDGGPGTKTEVWGHIRR